MRALLSFLLTLTLTTPVWAGGSRNFDGSDDEINLGNVFNYSGTQAFTVTAWVKLDTIESGDDDAILLRFNPGVFGQWGMRFEGTGTDTANLVCYREVTPFAVQGGTTLNAGTWYYLACVYDGTNMTGYVNGVADAGPTGMGSIASGTVNTVIGGNAGATFNLDGNIAHVRVWTRALSVVELFQEMFRVGTIPLSQAYWGPIFGTESTEIDLSGNSITGTVTGAVESTDGPPIMLSSP